MAIGSKLGTLLADFAKSVGGVTNPRYLTVLNAIQSSTTLENLFNDYAGTGKLAGITFVTSGTGVSVIGSSVI